MFACLFTCVWPDLQAPWSASPSIAFSVTSQGSIFSGTSVLGLLLNFGSANAVQITFGDDDGLFEVPGGVTMLTLFVKVGERGRGRGWCEDASDGWMDGWMLCIKCLHEENPTSNDDDCRPVLSCLVLLTLLPQTDNPFSIGQTITPGYLAGGAGVIETVVLSSDWQQVQLPVQPGTQVQFISFANFAVNFLEARADEIQFTS